MKPLTSKQKANAWHLAALLLDDANKYHDGGREFGDMIRLRSHIATVIVPHLRGMAKRIRRNAK